MPLQPLQDHLGSMVYENFEKDPVKYSKYEEAIYSALMDNLSTDTPIILCVAGAGRGPLIARSLTAAKRAKKKIVLYAIEKNPNAFVTLRERQRREWAAIDPKEASVNLLFGDMRQLEVTEKADILVSELLGSFGDNELSPECLDGATRFMKDDGISIPSSYAAYIAPISSSKLHQEAVGKDGKEGDKKSAETPYVVMLQAINILSADGLPDAQGKEGLFGKSPVTEVAPSAATCGPRIQQCWEFVHPRRDIPVDSRGLPHTNTHNMRAVELLFHIPHPGMLHGFAGYFEAVLYGNVGLSIHPDRMDAISKDMLSWFPCFFPVREPLYLPGNSRLQLCLWRLTSETKVWYEWYAESFLPAPAPEAKLSRRLSSASKASTQSNGTGPLSVTLSPPAKQRAGSILSSPMIDADDRLFTWEKQSPSMAVDETHQELPSRFPGHIKIGQTSVHNPGGRSSWYGL